MHAQVSQGESSLQLTLRRPKKTRGKKFYNREQILKLPSEPTWFLELQKRFTETWTEHRSKIKSPCLYAPLILPRNHHHNRPPSDTLVQRRINRATLAATGQPIPTRILRQTCGHIYSMNNDASMLSRLGWSTSFSFQYTWRPRCYFKSTRT